MKKNTDVVRIFGGGKITIPKQIRKILGLRDGDFLGVAIEENEAKIIYYPVKFHPVKPKT